jgi:alpha-glucosidase
MHKALMLFFFSGIYIISNAQYQLTFQINNLPPYHNESDEIYAAGSFNNWNPAQQQAKFERDENGLLSLSLGRVKGKYEFKITKGSWEKVECGAVFIDRSHEDTCN